MLNFEKFEVAAYNRACSNILLLFTETGTGMVINGSIAEGLIKQIDNEYFFRDPQMQEFSAFKRLEELVEEALVLGSVVLEKATKEQEAFLARK
jgi:hypothetical protein